MKRDRYVFLGRLEGDLTEINMYLDLMRYIQKTHVIIIVIIFCDKYSCEALRNAQTGSEQGVALQSSSVSFPTVQWPYHPQAHSAILPIITPFVHASCFSSELHISSQSHDASFAAFILCGSESAPVHSSALRSP